MESTLIYITPVNSNNFHQIGKFRNIFDTRWCEIDDLAVLSCQMAPLRGNIGKVLMNLVNFDLVNSVFSLNFFEIHAIESFFE